MSLAACQSGLAPVPSEWPPDDFELVLEELRESHAGAVVARRFSVSGDGLCVYAEAAETIGDRRLGVELPVFAKVCAYRLLQVSTRLLARQLYKRGVLELDQAQGDQRATDQRSIRLSYRAFGNERLVVAAGQIHGAMVRILHVVNAYLPPGDSHRFRLPGMAGDPEPEQLSFEDWLRPVDDAAGALVCHLQLLDLHPDDPELLLSAFALACWERDRTRARRLLGRWVEVTGIGATSAAPFSDPPRVTREMLEAILRDA